MKDKKDKDKETPHVKVFGEGKNQMGVVTDQDEVEKLLEQILQQQAQKKKGKQKK